MDSAAFLARNPEFAESLDAYAKRIANCDLEMVTQERELLNHLLDVILRERVSTSHRIRSWLCLGVRQVDWDAYYERFHYLCQRHLILVSRKNELLNK